MQKENTQECCSKSQTEKLYIPPKITLVQYSIGKKLYGCGKKYNENPMCLSKPRDQ